VRVRAQSEGDEEDVPEQITFGELLGELWRRGRAQMEQYTERVDQQGPRPGPAKSQSVRSGSSEGTKEYGDETQLTDIITNETFQQLGLLVSIGAVLIVAILFGPPPE
jgi:hypothetical protein